MAKIPTHLFIICKAERFKFIRKGIWGWNLNREIGKRWVDFVEFCQPILCLRMVSCLPNSSCLIIFLFSNEFASSLKLRFRHRLIMLQAFVQIVIRMLPMR